MSKFSFVVNDLTVELKAAFTGEAVRKSNTMVGQIAIAATGAIQDAAKSLKEDGRASIRAGGFSSRWQNAWRVTVYPTKGVSLDAAVWAFHKIAYASAFEDGGTIRGKKGMLWLPLPNAPKGRGVKGSPLRIRPSALRDQGIKLFSINRPGKPPILATRVRGVEPGNLSISQLKSGNKKKKGEAITVPLFVGVNSVTLAKRFDLKGVAAKVQGRLAEFYFNHVKA